MALNKKRLEKLELRLRRSAAQQVPFVVSLRDSESLLEAEERALGGKQRPANWRYVLCPEQLEEQAWIEKYGLE